MEDLILAILVFAFAGLVLTRSSAYLVSSLSDIGSHLKITEFAVSFILMAIATSLPELFVGMVAAFNGESQFALGMVIGSNIVNLTLISGVSIILAGTISADNMIKKKDGYYMMIVSVISLTLLVIGNGLSRIDGFILLVVYAIYVRHLIEQGKQRSKVYKDSQKSDGLKTIMTFIVGLVLLVFSSEMLVRSSEQIALGLGIPIIVIGLVVVAFGTSIPELSFNVTAIREHKKSMVMGEILGSVVANSALILGIVALIEPVVVTHMVSAISAYMFLLVAIVVFIWAMLTDRKFTKMEGVFLVMIYVIYVIVGYISAAY